MPSAICTHRLSLNALQTFLDHSTPPMVIRKIWQVMEIDLKGLLYQNRDYVDANVCYISYRSNDISKIIERCLVSLEREIALTLSKWKNCRLVLRWRTNLASCRIFCILLIAKTSLMLLKFVFYLRVALILSWPISWFGWKFKVCAIEALEEALSNLKNKSATLFPGCLILIGGLLTTVLILTVRLRRV